MNTRNTIIYLYFYSNNYMFLYFTKSSVLAIRGTSLEVPLLVASPDESWFRRKCICYYSERCHKCIAFLFSIYFSTALVYCTLLYIWAFNKNNSNCLLHSLDWINSSSQVATIYLGFLKSKNTYIKLRINLFVK